MTDNLKGALLMMGSMAAYTFNDAAIKAAGGQIPLFQLILMRGVLVSLSLLLLAKIMRVQIWRLRGRDRQLVVLRTLSEIGATFFFLEALMRMPLGNITAIMQMLPLTVVLGAALAFREPVGWRRMLAIAVGFVGMLLIVQPGTDGFNAWSIYVLIAVAFVTARDLLARRISAETPSLTVAFATSIGILVFAVIGMAGQGWVSVTVQEFSLIALAAVFILFGYLFSMAVMRVGDVASTAPFRYTGLIWALLIGAVMFGERPSFWMLVGAALIVGSGVFTMYRERVLRKRS